MYKQAAFAMVLYTNKQIDDGRNAFGINDLSYLLFPSHSVRLSISSLVQVLKVKTVLVNPLIENSLKISQQSIY